MNWYIKQRTKTIEFFKEQWEYNRGPLVSMGLGIMFILLVIWITWDVSKIILTILMIFVGTVLASMFVAFFKRTIQWSYYRMKGNLNKEEGWWDFVRPSRWDF